MEYMNKNEVTGALSTINSTLNDLKLSVYGYNTNLPITLSNLGTDVTAYYDPAQFYKKGEAIASADLPTVPTKAYVDSRTRGLLTSVLGYHAIDEIVTARQSQTDLTTNLNRYSLKSALITNINALSSGTINNTRLQPQDHNSLTNRTVADAHPTSAITNLDTTLGLKTAKATILATINASIEATKIDPDQIQPISHSDLSDRTDADSHDVGSITNLTTLLADGQSAKSEIDAVLAGTGYASLDALVDCIRKYLQNIDGVGLPSAPACWEVVP